MSGGRRSQGAADGKGGGGVLAYQHAHASLTGQRDSCRGRIWSGSARSTIHILLMPPPPQEGKMCNSGQILPQNVLPFVREASAHLSVVWELGYAA